MSGTTLILVAALALDAAAVLFFVRAERDPSSASRVVALCVAAVVTLGAGIVALNRQSSKERAALFVETNRALRSLAARTGLVVGQAPVTKGSARGFDELHGTFKAVRVVATVESPASDELATSLFFPRSLADGPTLAALKPLADSVTNEGGLKLLLSRRPSFLRPLLLDYDRIPETDVQRLLTVLDRASDLLGRGRAASASAPNLH